MGTDQSPVYPIGTNLGNKGQTPAALRSGWVDDLSTEQILERLLKLNVERAEIQVK